MSVTAERISTDTNTGPGFILLAAACFGLLASWIELAGMAAGKYIAGVYIYDFGPHLLWMTPLAYMLMFLLPGVMLAGAARIFPRLASLRVCITLFAFLATAAVLSLFVRHIHWSALLLVAIGVGLQSGRFAASHARMAHNFVRRGILAMAALSAVLASAGGLARRWSEGRAQANLPPAPSSSPNVLFIVLDAVRAMNLSVYGYQRPTTPNLERLAEQSVVFEWAFAPSSWSLPSHASAFTGRYPFELSAAVRVPLDDAHPTLAETLRSQGYLTAGFVGNLGYTGRASGLARGFVHYEDFANSFSQLIGATALVRTALHRTGVRALLDYYQIPGRKSAERLSQDFLDWQARHPERPFFAFINYFDAHAPYVPPTGFEGRFGSNRGTHLIIHERSVDLKRGDTGRRIQSQIDAYDNLVAYLDHQLGLLVGQLERRGLLHNTIIVVTADHGEEFGEHGRLGHGDAMTATLLHVPLIVIGKSHIPAGTRVSAPVSLRDLPATILELTRVHDPQNRLPGSALTRHWTDGSTNSEFDDLVISTNGPLLSLVTARYHYVRNGDGREELYAYREDRLEQNDLAATPAAVEILRQFRAFTPGALSKAR
jgi:arylsulfatase A-like enzyme